MNQKLRFVISSCSLTVLLLSCRHETRPIVEPQFVDSLLKNYKHSTLTMNQDSSLVFWERRMDTLPDDFVRGPELAGHLVARFRRYGDIADLLRADSLMVRSNFANQGKEAGIFRAIAGFALLRHQFNRADSNLAMAVAIDGSNIANTFLEFDIAFEQGKIERCKALIVALNRSSGNNNYAVWFRRSKLEHYDGSLDSSIAYMERAATLANESKSLRQSALSNAADLNIHNDDLARAYNEYKTSLQVDAIDMHSLLGIGWIALAHDKNDSLAERIFNFVSEHSHAPDALLKLVQVAEARHDNVSMKKYAEDFVARANAPGYGHMYNKYLVDLYTSVLHEPKKAIALAEEERNNRSTPQVFAWYAYSLLMDGQNEKAYSIYQQYVAKQRLEGPELYYMGKLMQALDKGYNAQQFFKAANKNRYDLSIMQQEDLQKSLE